MRPSYITTFHPSLKIIVLLAVVISSFLVFFLLGTGIGMIFFGREIIDSLTTPAGDLDERSLAILKYFQVVNQIGVFIVPALLFAWLNDKDVNGYLNLNPVANIRFYLLGVVILFAALPFINWLIDINNNIDLPPVLAPLEDWFRRMENEALELNEAFLETTRISGFLVNIFMIALLASLGEELIFRGVLIRIFREWTGNIHMAVLISAFLFSAFHFQFYGFLPRMMLGAILGYLFVRSGTLWAPILVHFINNGMAVLLSFLSSRGLIDFDLEDGFGSTGNAWIILLSVVLTFGIMIYIRILGKRRETGC